MTPERLEGLREAHQRGMSIHGYHALAEEMFPEVDWLTTALDVARQALLRIHDRADITPSLRTIIEHALRNERFESPLWVCAVCTWTSSESEPCPEHGHTGAPWCCDKCAASVDRTMT